MENALLETSRENQIIATVSHIHSRTGFREPPFSFKKFFDEFSGYKVIAARLPRGFDGELLRKGSEKIIRYRVESRDLAVRFTIAHEIAHSFLHHREDYCCRIERKFRIYEPPSAKPKEDEADFFALELLMPMPMLNRMVPPMDGMRAGEINGLSRELAQVFGINTITMKSRLKDLAIYRSWDEAEWL